MSMRIAVTAVIAMAIPMCVPAEERDAKPPTYTVLYTFTGGADGGYPQYGGLMADAAGNLYGTATFGGDVTGGASSPCGTFGCGVVFKVDQNGKQTVLYAFKGPDGSFPLSRLFRDRAGNLYGTTLSGGSSGSGTVFKLEPCGKETVLYSFPGGADGEEPGAGVVRDHEGNLYGTTFNGGAHGSGVVFKLDAAGEETVLHAFTGGADGENPYGGLVRDEDGNLYGTTPYGGDSACSLFFGEVGCGVVFKIDRAGNETVLHAFTGDPDGSGPDGGLVRDKDGNLYGATGSGGSNFWGTVFKVEPCGTETVLHSFTGANDGGSPDPVVRDHEGNLYGATAGGGIGGVFGNGVVFKLDRAGKETVLYSFPGGTDGSHPGDLIRDYEGNLYGTTSYGGDLSACAGFGCGVVFRLDPAGKETVLYSFTGGTDGSGPGDLIRDHEGNLYGATAGGGDLSACSPYGGCGVVFKIQLHEECKRDAQGNPEPDGDVDNH